MTIPVLASITVVSLLLPLNVNRGYVPLSYRIASGFLPVSTLPVAIRVFRSKMVRLFARPLLMKPFPRSVATAIPCTPGVSGIVPTTFLAAHVDHFDLVAVRYIQPLRFMSRFPFCLPGSYQRMSLAASSLRLSDPEYRLRGPRRNARRVRNSSEVPDPWRHRRR
jgi:hypothetical protein